MSARESARRAKQFLIDVVAGDGPPDADPDWDTIIAVARSHQLVPWLWWSARDRELLEPVPATLRAVFAEADRQPVAALLESAWDHHRRRTDDLLDQFDDAIAVLAGAGIPVMPLKGAALQVLDVFPDRACRTMTDLDLLVARQDADRAASLLCSIGYVPIEQDDRGPQANHHGVPLRNPCRFGSIELHTEPLDARWGAALPAAQVRSAGVEIEWRNHTIAVPCPSDLVIHALAHSYEADSNRRRRRVDLRTELDVHQLRQTHIVDDDRVRWSFERLGRTQTVDLHHHVQRHLFDRPGPRPTLAARGWLTTAQYLDEHPALAERTLALVRVFPPVGGDRLRGHYGQGSIRELRRRRRADLADRMRRRRPTPS
jgi:hypothetical protein